MGISHHPTTALRFAREEMEAYRRQALHDRAVRLARKGAVGRAVETPSGRASRTGRSRADAKAGARRSRGPARLGRAAGASNG